MQKKEYHISRKELRKLHKAAYIAQQNGHFEVCGLLVIDEREKIQFLFLANAFNVPYKYELNVKNIISIRRKLRAQQKKILGSFHSHPIGYATPSIGDIERGFYKRIELIYDVCAKLPRLWTYRRKATEKIAIELPLRID